MTEPILVVDIGTALCTAAIVAEERTALLRDPHTRADHWPASLLAHDGGWLVGTAAERHRRQAPARFVDGVRRSLDDRAPVSIDGAEISGATLVGAYLSALTAEAHRVYGSPIPRLVLAVPAGYAEADPRREELIDLGEAAGFREVELIDDPVAVTLDPQLPDELPGDTLVLVCDLGVSWTASCVYRRGDRSRLVAQRGAPSGDDLDALMLARLRAEAGQRAEPLLAAPGDAGQWARYESLDLVRRLRQRLGGADEVYDRLTPLAPPYRLTRAQLAADAEPAIATLLRHCRTVITAAGATPADIGAVILAGGAAQLPGARDALAAGLGHPVRSPDQPEYSVVRGAARWAARAAERRVPALTPGWRTEPVAWDIPGGRAWVVRWAVPDGQEYPANAVLAEIRGADGQVMGLTAPRAGTLLGPLPPAGTAVGPVLAVPVRRTAAALATDSPPLLRTAATAGSYLLSADRHVLLECDATGTEVLSYAAASGELLGSFRPEQPGVSPPSGAGGRIFVDPQGRPALLSWDPVAGVSAWDVQSGKLTVRIAEAVGMHRVFVDETTWRMAVESEGRASVGRYRRSAVTVWDLHTGGRLEELRDNDWARRHPAFRRRSMADGFGAAALSPDGRLHAAVHPSGVLLRDPVAGQDLFGAHPPEGTAGVTALVAFDGDGLRLLINWESEGRSRLDVLQT